MESSKRANRPEQTTDTRPSKPRGMGNAQESEGACRLPPTAPRRASEKLEDRDTHEGIRLREERGEKKRESGRAEITAWSLFERALGERSEEEKERWGGMQNE